MIGWREFMKNIKSKKIKTAVSLINRYLLVAIVLFLLAIPFYIWAYMIETQEEKTPVGFTEQVASGTLTSGEYVELKVTEIPRVFAEYDSSKTSDKYYFVWSDNYLNVAFLDYATYQKLSQEDIHENPITIRGMTKALPNDVIDLAISGYNEMVGEEFLTAANYQSYLSTLYIDTTADLHNSTLQVFFGVLFTVLGIIFLTMFIAYRKKFKKMWKHYSEREWNRIFKELESEDVKTYKKSRLYLTENYIVGLNHGLTVVPYEDLAWVYPYQLKQYGITTSRSLVLWTKKKERYTVASLEGIMKSKAMMEEVMDFIVTKNPALLVGFNDENRKRAKDLYQIR